MDFIGFRYQAGSMDNSTATRGGDIGILDLLKRNYSIILGFPMGKAVDNKELILGLSFEWDPNESKRPIIKYIQFNFGSIQFTQHNIPASVTPAVNREIIRRESLGPLRSFLERLSLNRNEEFEFHKIRDEKPTFGFAYFNYEELRAVANLSNTLLLSGAYIRPGIVKHPALGEKYQEKAYFTFKFEGDMEIFREKIDSLIGNKDIPDPSTTLGKIIRDLGPDYEEYFTALANRIRSNEVGLTNAVMGHPCPPVWEMGRIEKDIFNQLALIEGVFEIEKEGEKDTIYINNGVTQIKLTEYRELIKFAYREYVNVFYGL